MRSSTSTGVDSGGDRQIVSPIGGSALPARMRGKRPRASASRVKRAPEPESGRLGAAVADQLDAAHHAEPRTSPTTGRSRNSSSPASSRPPIAAARSTSPSLSMIPTLASPTAQHTGWPE